MSHIILFCFFFSSRRRHTRYWRDWSSDVCSSDLQVLALGTRYGVAFGMSPEAHLRVRDLIEAQLASFYGGGEVYIGALRDVGAFLLHGPNVFPMSLLAPRP